MPLTWNATFNTSPPESQDHGRGGERIRETRGETLLRFQPEHNVGDPTLNAGYSDTGRHSPGSARAFTGGITGGVLDRLVAPTGLQRPDSGGVAIGGSSFVALLGAADDGRLWVDQSGGASVFRYYDVSVAPRRWSAVYGYNNALINGSFQVWQRNSSATINCPAATSTYTADRWYVNPTGAACTVQLDTAPGFAAPQRSTASFRVNGVAALTQFILGTRIEAANVPRLRVNGNLNFSIRVRNAATGVTLTPTLRVSTANVSNNFGAVFLESTPVLPDVLNNTEAYLTTTLDTSGYANNNGLQIELTFVGSAAIAAGQVFIGEAILEWGLGRSVFVEPPFEEELRACQRYYEKTYSYAVTPGTAASPAGALWETNEASNPPTFPWVFKTSKVRPNYTVTIYNPDSGATGSCRNYSAATSPAITSPAIAVAGVDPRGTYGTAFRLVAVAGADGEALAAHATCEADLV